ncbi:hypothetical protein JOP69_15300 [Polaribacter sp. Q13]|nr:hypothetical protein JOP69_15300 [Polaribacter sp. Q13]
MKNNILSKNKIFGILFVKYMLTSKTNLVKL